jgi:hypothetical protein
LGERLPYKEDVGGSSPSSPTIKSLQPQGFFHATFLAGLQMEPYWLPC